MAQVWFSSLMATRSLASTAWWRPSDHRRPSSVRPVNSSTIFTSPLWHEVVLVPLVEVLGRQRLRQLVDVVDRHGVVDVLDADRLLHLLDPRLERDDRLLLLVHLVVDVTGQRAGDGGELVVELRRLVGRPRDDERRAGLVDEDGVDLVDDGEDMARAAP